MGKLRTLVVLFAFVLLMTGCTSQTLETEATEISYQASNDVKSYKFAKPDGDYSELKVNKDQGITSEDIAKTFNNFWTFEETDKTIDEKDEILEEDVLTYKNRTCNYIIYKNGLAKYTDSRGTTAVLAWKSNYVY